VASNQSTAEEDSLTRLRKIGTSAGCHTF
jgi:hypothetical protein